MSDTYSPSQGELDRWVSSLSQSGDDVDEYLEVVQEASNRLSEAFYEETGRMDDPPPNYSRSEVTISAEEHDDITVYLGESLAGSEVGKYAPTREELINWIVAEQAAGHEERALEIVDKAVNLRDLFREQTGDPKGIPELNYWHPEVTLSAAEHEEMNKAIYAEVRTRGVELD